MQYPNLKDYVIVLDDVLPLSVCDKILEEYANSGEWQQTVVGKGDVREDIRSATTIQMSADFVVARNAELRREIDSDVFAGLQKRYRNITQTLSTASSKKTLAMTCYAMKSVSSTRSMWTRSRHALALYPARSP